MERWVDIIGFEGLYEVSNLGNIKSGNRIRKFGIDSGYKRVVLYKNSKPFNMLIHRLVATAFLPNPKKLEQVNHIDGDKQNNNVENLEWCSRSENMLHAFRLGLIAKRRVA